MLNKRLNIWIEGTVVAALAMALSFIPLKVGYSFSISLGMIPLTLYAFRRGVKPAFFAGFLWGLLHFITSQIDFLTVSQVLIEYLIAFAFSGVAGFFSGKVQQAVRTKNNKQSIIWITIGTLAGTSARYFWHFIAGMIFWGKYALWGLSPFAYSFVFNGACVIATSIVTIVALLLIEKVAPSLFLPKNSSISSIASKKM